MKYYVRVYTREPKQMFRAKDTLTLDEVNSFIGMVSGTMAYVNLTGKDDRLIVIPGPNVSYVEFLPVSEKVSV